MSSKLLAKQRERQLQEDVEVEVELPKEEVQEAAEPVLDEGDLAEAGGGEGGGGAGSSMGGSADDAAMAQATGAGLSASAVGEGRVALSPMGGKRKPADGEQGSIKRAKEK